LDGKARKKKGPFPSRLAGNCMYGTYPLTYERTQDDLKHTCEREGVHSILRGTYIDRGSGRNRRRYFLCVRVSVCGGVVDPE